MSKATTEIPSLKTRFAAQFADSIIFLPLSILVWFYTKDLNSSDIQYSLYWLVYPLILFLYEVYFLQKYGATLGKMFMKIKVISMSKKLTLGQVVIRQGFLLAFFNVIPTILEVALRVKPEEPVVIIYTIASFVFFMGVFLLNKKRRGIHDFAANTMVVKSK